LDHGDPKATMPDLNPIQILGRPNSINVRKVLWLATELGLPYLHQPWGQDGLDLRSPEYLALNPNGLVPVVRDGDFVLWESNTICRYLAAREGRSDLLPTAPRARAEVERWMDWQAGELNTAWRHAFLGLVRQHPAFQDTAASAQSAKAWNRLMQILEAQLQHNGTGYVTGPHFTLADLVLALAAHRWLMTPIDRPALPAILAWVDRLMAHEGYRLHGRNGVP
jgi:glutathione S-transferase